MFVKNTDIAKRHDVHFERFQFQTRPVRRICDVHNHKIRQTGLGTNAGAFGNVKMNRVLTVGILILEDFNRRCFQLADLVLQIFVRTFFHKNLLAVQRTPICVLCKHNAVRIPQYTLP